MKKFQPSIPIIGTILSMAVVLSISYPYPSLGRPSARLIIAERPKPPLTGTPSGDPTPAATRPPETSCPETPKPLTALLANNGSDFTLSEYPTFWFYIPYPLQRIGYMEFLLRDAQEDRIVYHQALKLTDRPGFIQLPIPPDPQYALEVNKNYRWHFNLNLDCAEPYFVVQGWIRRVPMTSQLENQLEALKPQEYLAYQEGGIWYDAIANLAQLHFANPKNQELSSAWSKLLESLHLAGVSEEPLVNSELLPPKD